MRNEMCEMGNGKWEVGSERWEFLFSLLESEESLLGSIKRIVYNL